MNIYIYGSQSFKKDIKDELKRSMVDYKLGDSGLIQDVKSLNTLKELIEDNSDDVFLIDDAKIIKDNLINSKIKFLKPKDGIEYDYLQEKGIEDLSVDSIHDISKHILKKMDNLGISNDDLDDVDEIHSSISEIVNDAYDSENQKDEGIEEDQNEDDNIDYELDDDLKNLLSSDEENQKDEENIEEDIEEDIMSNQKLDENIEEVENIKMTSLYEDKDEDISNLRNLEDITSLDELTEDDIIAALSGKDISLNTAKKIEKKAQEMSIKLDNPEDIKDFLNKLLNSKALEITVKIKE